MLKEAADSILLDPDEPKAVSVRLDNRFEASLCVVRVSALLLLSCHWHWPG